MKLLITSILIVLSINSSFAQSNIDTLKSTTLTVTGLTCNGDMSTIKKKLINQDGIDEVNYTELKKGKVTFTVKYHSSITTEKQIREWIESVPGCDDPNVYPYKASPFIIKFKKQ
jgi:copper chaperone CopZ